MLERFITELSSVIRNCPAASVISTVEAACARAAPVLFSSRLQAPADVDRQSDLVLPSESSPREGERYGSTPVQQAHDRHRSLVHRRPWAAVRVRTSE